MTVPIPVPIRIPDPPTGKIVRLLAGAKISAIPSVTDGVITQLDQVQSLLTQLGPGLAAAAPIFSLVNGVTAVFDLVQAVITADIPGIVEAVEKTAEAIADMATLLPQAAVPILVIDSLRCIVDALIAVQQVLDDLLEIQAIAQDLFDTATGEGDALLAQVALDQLDQVSQLTKHACASMGPVGDLLGVVQNLLKLVPGLGPALPLIPDCSGKTLPVMAVSLAETITSLQDHPLFERVPPEAPPLGGVDVIRAGVVGPSAFSGSPPTAIVIFQKRAATTNYSVTFTVVDSGATIAAAVGNKSRTGFTITLGTEPASGFTEVGWQVFPAGG